MFLGAEWPRLLGIWSWRGSLDSKCHNGFAVCHTNACKRILEVVFCCSFHVVVSQTPVPASKVYATFHRPHDILYSDKQPMFEGIVNSHHSLNFSYRQRVVDVNGCPEVRFTVIESGGHKRTLLETKFIKQNVRQVVRKQLRCLLETIECLPQFPDTDCHSQLQWVVR